MDNGNDDLFEAAKQGNIADVQRLIPLSDPEVLSDALQTAAYFGHSECVRMLIPVTNSQKDALKSAALCGHFECLQLLLPLSTFEKRTQALQLAASSGHHNCVELLISVSDPMTNDSGALMLATANGFVECVKLLIPVSKPYKGLHTAVRTKNIDCLRLLVDATDFTIIENYNTPLWTCVEDGNLEFLKIFVAKFNCKEQHNLALKFAAYFQNPECMEYLYPLSEPEAALDQLKMYAPNKPDACFGLERMIAEKTAAAQNAVLQACVKHSYISTPTKDRKI